MQPVTNDDNLFPVVIIGAGLAGLTAALYLAEQGITPLVLEADQHWPGGRLAGGDPDRFEYGGQAWAFESDHGVHALWGGYDNLRALLKRFNDIDLRQSQGEEWINRWKRQVRVIEAGTAVRSTWLPAPFHYLQLLFRPRFWATITPLDFLSLPGFLFSILWTVGFDPIKEGVALDGLMMKEYFRGWTPNLKATFTGLGANLLAAPPESISLTAFIAALRFYTILRRDTWNMHYFPGNLHTCLIAPLICAVERMGGKVMRGVTAQNLQQDGANWCLQVEDASRRGLRSVHARQVILAVNAPAAERLLCSSPSTAGAAARIRFPGAVRNATIRLWFSKQPRAGAAAGMFTGDFAPDNFFWLTRLYDDFREWGEVAGGSAIELHFYANDAMLEQPDNVLLIIAIDEVQRAFPELKGHFVHGTVRRNSRLHTQFRVPTSDSLHIETPWENIFACGDWIGHPTPAFWMERATVTGIAAANQVLATHGSAPVDIIPPQKPEGLAWALGGIVRIFRATIGRVIFSIARWLRRASSKP